MKINYITNLPLTEISGGFSGMNAAAHGAISSLGDTRYIGPVNPPPGVLGKASSKLSRLMGGKGKFNFFSSGRLSHIAADVRRLADPDADLDFYHGFTPWIAVDATRPYVAWNDCSFLDYVTIFLDRSQFAASDIDRICSREAAWLKSASQVILSSEWARERIISDYGLDPAKVVSVGIFGAMEPPQRDEWDGALEFLFISTNFQKKNGSSCRKAMERVWEQYPNARLRIIGSPPPPEVLIPDRVTYEGFFKKSVPAELLQFRSLLSKAFAILHPTDADTTAMILIEAAFFGCPAISVDDFAIPEVLGRERPEFLLPRPVAAETLADAMLSMIAMEESYPAIRQAVRSRALQMHTIGNFQARLRSAVTTAMTPR